MAAQGIAGATPPRIPSRSTLTPWRPSPPQGVVEPRKEDIPQPVAPPPKAAPATDGPATFRHGGASAVAKATTQAPARPTFFVPGQPGGEEKGKES